VAHFRQVSCCTRKIPLLDQYILIQCKDSLLNEGGASPPLIRASPAPAPAPVSVIIMSPLSSPLPLLEPNLMCLSLQQQGRAKEGSPPPRKTGGPCRPRAKTEAPALAPAASKGSALKGRAMRLSKGSPKRSCTTRSLARLTGRACSLQVGAVWCAVGVQV
jgi:hypothetical protein